MRTRYEDWVARSPAVTSATQFFARVDSCLKAGQDGRGDVWQINEVDQTCLSV